MIARFAVEFLKAVAIILALPLTSGIAVETLVYFLSDRDIGATYGASLAGLAAGVLGLVVAITIVVRRIADIED
jgi:hypothetical protein